MKKVLLSIAFLVFVQIAAFSSSNPISKPFKIQGGFGSVLHVTVSPISTQSTSFMVGMPFDIEEDLVQNAVMKDGRTIANWSMVANTSFKIKVNAGLLTSEGKYVDESGVEKHRELSYILKFDYSFGYYNTSGTVDNVSGSFSINNESGVGSYTNASTGNEDTVSWTTDKYFVFDLLPSKMDKKGISGTVDGHVYFMFSDVASSIIQNQASTVPSGNYYAYVTITLEGDK